MVLFFDQIVAYQSKITQQLTNKVFEWKRAFQVGSLQFNFDCIDPVLDV